MVAGDAKRVSQYFTTEETNQLIVTVQNRGAEVMKAQQASSALSAANAIGKHLKDWICPTDLQNVFSMGMLSDGNPYGVPDGLCYSFPCRHGANGNTPSQSILPS